MTTSATHMFLSEILSGGDVLLAGVPIPRSRLAYFQERFKARVYELVVNEFLRQRELDPSLTQAAIARRLSRRPEQINRWLSGPNNLELESVSDLLLGITGGEPTVAVSPLRPRLQPHADADTDPQNVIGSEPLAKQITTDTLMEAAQAMEPAGRIIEVELSRQRGAWSEDMSQEYGAQFSLAANENDHTLGQPSAVAAT